MHGGERLPPEVVKQLQDALKLNKKALYENQNKQQVVIDVVNKGNKIIETQETAKKEELNSQRDIKKVYFEWDALVKRYDMLAKKNIPADTELSDAIKAMREIINSYNTSPDSVDVKAFYDIIKDDTTYDVSVKMKNYIKDITSKIDAFEKSIKEPNSEVVAISTNQPKSGARFLFDKTKAFFTSNKVGDETSYTNIFKSKIKQTIKDEIKLILQELSKVKTFYGTLHSKCSGKQNECVVALISAWEKINDLYTSVNATGYVFAPYDETATKTAVNKILNEVSTWIVKLDNVAVYEKVDENIKTTIETLQELELFLDQETKEAKNDEGKIVLHCSKGDRCTIVVDSINATLNDKYKIKQSEDENINKIFWSAIEKRIRTIEKTLDRLKASSSVKEYKALGEKITDKLFKSADKNIAMLQKIITDAYPNTRFGERKCTKADAEKCFNALLQVLNTPYTPPTPKLITELETLKAEVAQLWVQYDAKNDSSGKLGKIVFSATAEQNKSITKYFEQIFQKLHEVELLITKLETKLKNGECLTQCVTEIADIKTKTDDLLDIYKETVKEENVNFTVLRNALSNRINEASKNSNRAQNGTILKWYAVKQFASNFPWFYDKQKDHTKHLEILEKYKQLDIYIEAILYEIMLQNKLSMADRKKLARIFNIQSGAIATYKNLLEQDTPIAILALIAAEFVNRTKTLLQSQTNGKTISLFEISKDLDRLMSIASSIVEKFRKEKIILNIDIVNDRISSLEKDVQTNILALAVEKKLLQQQPV
jgi:hypothetical protein